MNDFLLVFTIALIASFLTYLGAPAAERFDVPQKVIGAALQFAAGIITALVAFSLMPPAIRSNANILVVFAFFFGGVLYVALEYASLHIFSAKKGVKDDPIALALYIGILVDLVIDGIVIGIGATLTLATGLLLALGMAISTAPLTFVTIATAKRQGIPQKRRRLLGILCFLGVLTGALIGYLVLRNQSLGTRLILIALASGFLITTVTQGMIPEANREGEPGFAGLFYIGGLSLYGMMFLTLK